MFRNRCLHGLTILALVAAGGCKNKITSPSPTPFTVSAGTGTSPAYTWAAGQATKLSIVRTSAGTTVVWEVTTSGANGVSSPVIQGTVPAGATRTYNAEPVLTTAIQYRVTVTRLDGSTGTATFTP